MHDDIASRVDALLAGDGDSDALWQALATALADDPDDARLLRQRARLAEAFGDHTQRVADLNRLAELAPGDAELQLEAALTQHRMAYFCAAQQARAGQTDEYGDEDEDDDGAAEATTLALQADALARLLALADTHIADAAFLLRLLDGWNEAQVQQPWQRLRLLLSGLAARPASTALRRLLALHWGELSRLDPLDYDPQRPPPVGFMIDALGGVHDALMVERALHALQPLIEATPEDVDLLRERAALNAACQHYADAAADRRRLAAALEATLAGPGEHDEATREQLAGMAATARSDAERCDGGRPAIVQGWLADTRQANSGLAAPWTPPPGRTIDDEARAMLDADRARRGVVRDSLLTELGEAGALLLAAAAPPDAARRAEIESIAQKVGPQIVGALQFEPSIWLTLSIDDLEAPPHPWLLQTGDTLQSLGWRHLAWCENPAYRRMFGQQVVTGLWVDTAGTSLAVAAAANTIRLVEIESEFEDGRQLATSASRGRNFASGGPMVDQLLVAPDLPLDELARIHAARVALRAAQTPQIAPRVVTDVAGFAAIQERQRQYKLAFRQAQGLTEFEARGLPDNHPEHLIPAVQREVRRALKAALKAHGQR